MNLNVNTHCKVGEYSCDSPASVLLYRCQLTRYSKAERGFKGRCMTAASFDVGGICTPACILKGF